MNCVFSCFSTRNPVKRIPHAGNSTAANTGTDTAATTTTTTSVPSYIYSLGSHQDGYSNDSLGVV